LFLESKSNSALNRSNENSKSNLSFRGSCIMSGFRNVVDTPIKFRNRRPIPKINNEKKNGPFKGIIAVKNHKIVFL
jgi:hypothetical protein